MTGSNGRATVTVPLSTSPGTTQIQASFGGDATHAASSDSAAPFTIAKATASLSPFSAFVTQTPTTNTGAVTTLSAALGGPLPVPLTTSPLIQRTVTFTLTGPVNKTVSTITDFLGQAKLPKGLPAGTYNVTATFDGDSTFTSATRTGSLVIAPFTGFFSPVDNPPTLNTVNAGSSIPVKFSLGGNRGLAIFAPGSPLASKITCDSGLPVDAIEETTTAAQRPRLRRGHEPVQVHLEDAEELRGPVLPTRPQDDRRQQLTARTSSSSSPASARAWAPRAPGEAGIGNRQVARAV